MLTNLIQRIKTVDGKLWKWLLAVAIFGGALYVTWRLRKKREEYDRAQLDGQFEAQQAQLNNEKAAVEKNRAVADMYRRAAKTHLETVKSNSSKVIVLTGEITKAQKELDAVKTWRELTSRAKGGG